MANPRGFEASRHINGSNCFSTNTYETSALTDLWQGQLVVMASGLVQEASANTTGPILGVAKAFYSSKNRPLTHNLPSQGNYLQAGQAGFVEVYIDPDIIFEVVADSAMSNLNVGNVGTIVATGSGNPQTGRSRQQIDASNFTAFASAQTADPLIIIGLGKRAEVDIGVGFEDGQLMEVMINNHVFRPKVIVGA